MCVFVCCCYCCFFFFFLSFFFPPNANDYILLLPFLQDLVFDFQPQDPENILVAVAALSGRKVPGKPLISSIFLDF